MNTPQNHLPENFNGCEPMQRPPDAMPLVTEPRLSEPEASGAERFIETPARPQDGGYPITDPAAIETDGAM